MLLYCGARNTSMTSPILPDSFPHPYGLLPPKVLAYESRYHPPTGGFKNPEGGYSYGPVELEVGRLWYSLVMLHRPQFVLETGTHQGYSTACIAAALRLLGGKRQVVTIDPEPLAQVWADTGLDANITLVKKRSQDAKPDVDALMGEHLFDMLVLDSDHHYETIMDEIMIYEPMLRDGGLMLFHDTLFFDGVGLAVEQVYANPRFETMTLDTPRHHEYNTLRSPGVTLARKKRSGAPAFEFNEQHRGVFHGDVATPAILHAKLG